MNDSVMISRLKNNAGPTSTAASVMTFQCSWPFKVESGCRLCQASMCLWAFSIMTIAASTIAPMAIAMPPNDMLLALMPLDRKRVVQGERGSVRVELGVRRNIKQQNDKQ